MMHVNQSQGWVDCHSHLADPRLSLTVDQVIARAQGRGIGQFLQGGVGPEDWQLQKKLQQKHPGVQLCFGLHPYWVADHSDDECELALDQLSREINQAKALGETGLDFRPHIMKDSQARQISVFEDQLELAKISHKPLVLHVVQAFDMVIRILELRGLGDAGGFLHSFNGSAVEAKAYLEMGLLLSFGGPVCRMDNVRLHQSVQATPLEKILIESDSPDQPPPRFQGQSNEPESIWDVAEMIGKLKGKTAQEILDISSQNLRKLVSI